MNQILALREKRANLWNQTKAFLDSHRGEDGMVSAEDIDENILKPCMDLPHDAGGDVPPAQRIAYLMENAVSILPMKLKDNIDGLLADALQGAVDPLAGIASGQRIGAQGYLEEREPFGIGFLPDVRFK